MYKRQEKGWEIANRGEAEKEQQPSRIMAASLATVYPLIAVLGIYIIISGADSPGGGFQGGALLSGIFISVHFSTGKKLADIHLLETLEKIAYLLIGATVSVFLLSHGDLSASWHRGYFLLMNLLIGLKVFSGLTIIYFLFRSIPVSYTHLDVYKRQYNKGGNYYHGKPKKPGGAQF